MIFEYKLILNFFKADTFLLIFNHKVLFNHLMIKDKIKIKINKYYDYNLLSISITIIRFL